MWLVQSRCAQAQTHGINSECTMVLCNTAARSVDMHCRVTGSFSRMMINSKTQWHNDIVMQRKKEPVTHKPR